MLDLTRIDTCLRKQSVEHDLYHVQMQLAETLVHTTAGNSEWEAHKAYLERELQTLEARMERITARGKHNVHSLELKIRYLQGSIEGLS